MTIKGLAEAMRIENSAAAIEFQVKVSNAVVQAIGDLTGYCNGVRIGKAFLIEVVADLMPTATRSDIERAIKTQEQAGHLVLTIPDGHDGLFIYTNL